MNSSGNSLVQAVRRQNRIRKRGRNCDNNRQKATNGQHASEKRHVKTNMEIFRSKEVIPLLEEDKYCPYCNSRWSMWQMLSVKNYGSPRQGGTRIHYYQEKWQCRNAEKMVTGHLLNRIPTALIHSPASPSMVAYVAMERSAWQCLTIVRNF